jgi:type III pantothenate kinase
MSLLAIDVGNTQVTLGVREGTVWRAHWRLRTSDRRTADEYAALVRALFRAENIGVDTVTSVAISSVVPRVTPLMVATAVALFGVTPLVIAPGIRTGLRIRYEPATDLGSDRILNAVAARAKLGVPAIVVDFGTATTFTVVDGTGDVIGGAIAPGVGVAAEALAHSGARLRRIELSLARCETVVGSNTEASMRSGVLYGHAALVDGLIERMQAELVERGSGRARVVATGGHSALMAPLLAELDAVDPDLTLNGLCLIHDLNAEAPT